MNRIRNVEVIDSCLLFSPGLASFTCDFLADTVALAPTYKQTGKSIVLWICGVKYIEKLEAQCVPYCKLRCPLRFVASHKFDLYASGDVYFCGVEYREIGLLPKL